MAARAPVVQREAKKTGPLVGSLRAAARLISVLWVALIFSILLEWIGMTWWWPEEGVRHSEHMLAQELRYLNDDFKESLFHARPVQLARDAAALMQRGTQAVGFERLIAGFPSNPLTAGLQTYLEAMANVMRTFVVRLTVLVLATPVFALFGLVGMAEGLMRRDLRRWGGGRESSFVYHHSKKLLAPSILSAWALYLAAPFTVHPDLVLLPFAVLFAVGVAVTTGTFKKYL